MAVYQNIKCTSCGYSFTGGWTIWGPRILQIIGPPVVKCPACDIDLVTGKAEWASSTRTIKVLFFSIEAFIFLAKAAVLRLVLLLLLDNLDLNNHQIISTITALVVAAFHTFLFVALTIKNSHHRTRALSESEREHIHQLLISYNTAFVKKARSFRSIILGIISLIIVLPIVVLAGYVILKTLIEIIFFL